MHNQIISTSGMEAESQLASDHSYHTGNWVDMSNYTQTTMPEYSGPYGYMPPTTHGLPSESLGRMPPPPPPPQQPVAQSHQNHPQLPMLMVPSNTTWPSELTHPNPSSYSAPPMSMHPLTVGLPLPLPLPLPQPTPPAPRGRSGGSNPRKTLTDDDRREMCKYAEAHPGVKQTEIGLLFGVERSTVSKVLRQKERFLYPEDRSSSPVKRNKVKSPDIEKALSTWYRNTIRTGVVVSDSDIKEKYRVFAASTGNSETVAKATSTTWLEKFKQKNGIGPGRLTRRASETNIPNGSHGSQASPALAPRGLASASPPALPSPSPVSANRSDDEREGGNYMDFESETASSLSGSALSPNAPFTFSPDPNVGAFLSSDQSRHMPPGSSNFHRPRSQTFPTLDLEYVNQPQTSDALTPKYSQTTTAPSSALDSPMHEESAPPFGIDTAVTSPHLRRSSSNSSMGPRSAGPAGPLSAVSTGSSPTSPSQDDARRAADTLLSFIQSTGAGGIVNVEDYNVILRLTDRLRIHASAVKGMGGLSRIPEGEVEMTNAPMGLTKIQTTSA